MRNRWLALTVALGLTVALLATVDRPSPSTRHVAELGLLALLAWLYWLDCWETPHD